LDALQSDCEFLLEGGVFTKDFIDHYTEYKRAEAKSVTIRPHPHEFSLYFDC
jgi:glutamine synthetase